LGTGAGLTSESKGDIVIGNDVWIGDYVVLLSGTIIGDGAIIGTHAVVRGKIPPYTAAYGNPCIVKYHRFVEEHIHLLGEMKWWDWEDDWIKEAYHFFKNKDVYGLYNFYKERTTK
jgi:chloramphenicol O-acetyltransferase type B